jgi:hypothetical protein
VEVTNGKVLYDGESLVVWASQLADRIVECCGPNKVVLSGLVTSERQIGKGLRSTLTVQAKWLEALTSRRFEDFATAPPRLMRTSRSSACPIVLTIHAAGSCVRCLQPTQSRKFECAPRFIGWESASAWTNRSSWSAVESFGQVGPFAG